jgi:hypothetical protein
LVETATSANHLRVVEINLPDFPEAHNAADFASGAFAGGTKNGASSHFPIANAGRATPFNASENFH